MTHNEYINLIASKPIYKIAIAVVGDESSLKQLKSQLKEMVSSQGLKNTPFKRVHLSPSINNLKCTRVDKITAGSFNLLFIYNAQNYGYINVYAVKREW